MKIVFDAYISSWVDSKGSREEELELKRKTNTIRS